MCFLSKISNRQAQNITAKITSWHGMIYYKLIQTMRMDAVKQYAQANQSIVPTYETIIKTSHINCDFEMHSAYVCGNNAQLLHEEVQTAASLGLSDDYVTNLSISVRTAPAAVYGWLISGLVQKGIPLK